MGMTWFIKDDDRPVVELVAYAWCEKCQEDVHLCTCGEDGAEGTPTYCISTGRVGEMSIGYGPSYRLYEIITGRPVLPESKELCYFELDPVDIIRARRSIPERYESSLTTLAVLAHKAGRKVVAG